jgi:hypothetical protein
MKDSFGAWLARHKWKLLLIGIVALMIISPISAVYDEQDNIITPFTAVIFLAVTFGTAEKTATIMLLTALTVTWLIISILTEGSGLFAGASLLAPLLFMVLLVAIFILLARWLIRAPLIDAEVLCAAICGYLLIGIFWTGLYAVMQQVDSKALISLTEPTVEKGDLVYFSYTTLTTTGFGDVIPKNHVARMLAVTEAIVGVFYNTIVIARFVGLYGIKTRGPGIPLTRE